MDGLRGRVAPVENVGIHLHFTSLFLPSGQNTSQVCPSPLLAGLLSVPHILRSVSPVVHSTYSGRGSFKKAKGLMLPLTLARSRATEQGLAKTPARSQMGPVPSDREVLLLERSTPTALRLSMVTTAEWL